MSCGSRSGQLRTDGPIRRFHAAASAPRPAAVCSSERCSTPARAVVERMGQRHIGLHPLETVTSEVELGERRRRDPERVDSSADVVDESRQGQLGRPAPAPDGVGRLDHGDRSPGRRQRDGRHQPVRPGPHHDGVVVGHSSGHGSSLSDVTGRQANRSASSGCSSMNWATYQQLAITLRPAVRMSSRAKRTTRAA